MPKIVKNNAILEAAQIETPIEAPGPNGETLRVALVGDWALWQETESGFEFKGFISDLAFREKHRPVS